MSRWATGTGCLGLCCFPGALRENSRPRLSRPPEAAFVPGRMAPFLRLQVHHHCIALSLPCLHILLADQNQKRALSMGPLHTVLVCKLASMHGAQGEAEERQTAPPGGGSLASQGADTQGWPWVTERSSSLSHSPKSSTFIQRPQPVWLSG